MAKRPRHRLIGLGLTALLVSGALILPEVVSPQTADAAQGSKKKRSKKRAPPPSKKKVAEPVEAPPPPPAADPELGIGFRGPTRIDFDDRLIQGQTNKSGAVYLFDRKETSIRSMVRRRRSFRDLTIATVYDR